MAASRLFKLLLPALRQHADNPLAGDFFSTLCRQIEAAVGQFNHHHPTAPAEGRYQAPGTAVFAS
jgi:hypothetical protein